MLWTVVDAAMVVLFCAVALRWVAFVGCAVVDLVQERGRRAALVAQMRADRPAVVVLVPAFHEERVIAQTVRRILQSDYPSVQVVVVDDGSADGTARAAATVTDARLRVVRQERNAGKAEALNRGLRESDAPIVVTVDADTWLAPDAISWMVASMELRDAAAVATHVEVGNRGNLWTRWQSLEYVAGLNIDRRAQSVMGIITTVPGAASAWRREVLDRHGGFSGRTLAEDTDLTLTLLRAGERVVFEARARSRTEAPTTASTLFRQRLRWLHGNLHCAWLHSAAWRGAAPWRVRLLALPNLWFAHLGVYLMLPVAIAYGLVEPSAATLSILAWVFGLLFIVDLVAMAVAYGFDQADWRDLPWAPSQRVGYPLFLWGVFAVVVQRIARGVSTRWNKLDRLGLAESGPDERAGQHDVGEV